MTGADDFRNKVSDEFKVKVTNILNDVILDVAKSFEGNELVMLIDILDHISTEFFVLASKGAWKEIKENCSLDMLKDIKEF